MTPLHITLFYSGLLGLLLILLSFNMMKSWVSAGGKDGGSDLALRRASALVSSFTDYVPMTLILMGLAESGGTPHFALHLLGSLVVLARLLHAFGSNFGKKSDLLRFAGAQLTYLTVTVFSFLCLYLYALPSLIR